MNLNHWAIKWGIPFEAVEDLRQQMGVLTVNSQVSLDDNESSVSNRIRLEASKLGWRLWRNNLGAVQTNDGRFIRYGLANDTKQLNQVIKSSDLIGIKSNGQFVAREVKRAGWQYSGTKREAAQLKFIQLIISLGGDASFTTGDIDG